MGMPAKDLSLGYEAAHESAAFCRVSDRRLFRVTGEDKIAYLQGMLSCDLKNIGPGDSLGGCVLTPKGRLLGELVAYHMGEEILLLCSSASSAAVFAALAHAIGVSGSSIADISSVLAFYYLCGPSAAQAAETAASMVKYKLAFDFWGTSGYFLCADIEKADELDKRLAGISLGRLGPETIKTLRVESGCPAYGEDMDHSVFPEEANLSGFISYSKGCYVGQETTAYIKNRGHLNRRIVAIKSAKALRPGADVFQGGVKVGRATSVVFSPALNAYLALAMVKMDFSQPGTVLQIRFGSQEESVTVTPLPVSR